MNCYIHVPFCASKCGYCAFYSEAGAQMAQMDAYLDHLEKVIIPENLTTLYVGGGTPTYLDCDRLSRLIEILRSKFSFFPDAEKSIEANPETLTGEKVAILRSFFTRISVGIQSFDAVLRQKIGRQCSSEALERALTLVREADFKHWNCDLIYSLPDENLSQWENDLHLAAGCGADHVSCYSLTPERSALLGQDFDVDDEREKIMFDKAQEVLSSYGINRYEVSNYAREDAWCQHNLNVWRGGLLRGYGPAAADFDGVDRHIEVESLDKWLVGVAPETDAISPGKRLNEIFAVNLRTLSGWTPELWQKVPGADSWKKRLDVAQKSAMRNPGCWQIGAESIRLSNQGLLWWNDIASDLL